MKKERDNVFLFNVTMSDNDAYFSMIFEILRIGIVQFTMDKN